MRLRQCAREGRGNPVPRGSLLVQGRHDTIGNECFQAAVLPPLFDRSRVAQELGQKNLVVASQTNCLVGSTALDEAVERLSRLRSAVDVITQEQLNRAFDWAICKIAIDAREEPGQEIGSAMDVSDGIYAHAGGYGCPLSRLSKRECLPNRTCPLRRGRHAS